MDDGLMLNKTISQVFTYDLQNKLHGEHVLHKKTDEIFEFRVSEAALSSVAAALETEYFFVRKDDTSAVKHPSQEMVRAWHK
ncbi:hypothetical protein V2A60_008883 [Cordyceps javanica]